MLDLHQVKLRHFFPNTAKLPRDYTRVRYQEKTRNTPMTKAFDNNNTWFFSGSFKGQCMSGPALIWWY